MGKWTKADKVFITIAVLFAVMSISKICCKRLLPPAKMI